MANWMGGSCPAMASQIVGGFCSPTAATLKGFLPAELQVLKGHTDFKQVRAVCIK